MYLILTSFFYRNELQIMYRLIFFIFSSIMLTQFSNCSSKTEMEVNDESNGLILFSESMVPVKLKSQKKEVSDFRLPIRIK